MKAWPSTVLKDLEHICITKAYSSSNYWEKKLDRNIVVKGVLGINFLIILETVLAFPNIFPFPVIRSENAVNYSLPVLKGLAVGSVGHSAANRKNLSFG